MTLKLILAFVIAFAVSAVVGFFLVPYLKRIKAGQSIKENGPTWHMSKQGTPTMGGLMFIAAIAVVCLSVGFDCMAEGEYGHLFCLAFALVFGAIGFLDDYEKLKKKQNLGLTAGKKILLQLAAAVAFIFLMRRFGYVALDSLYIPFWNKTVAISEPLYVIFAAFVIVGTVNSVNLTDGVDGLAASTTMPVCIFFAVLSILWGERFLSLGVFASGIAGGLLGFLIYNFNPAKVFMGDTGSLFLGGARRWLSLGFTTFQPSEIAKIAVVLFFSSMICTYKDQMQTIRYGVVPFMVITGGIVILLMLEPHLSASIIIMALAIVMMFVGGIKLSYLLIGMGGAGALLLIAGKFVPYVHKRIVSWRDPFADTSAAGYQIVQSLYSIGSGGFLGLGLGQSRQKYLYLPEEHNDYIFSIVCEELGYVGAVAILILFALLICRGYWIAAHSPDRYSFLVGVGITTLLSIQVFLNIAVVTNLIPCTGISLPFFSYGGTALLMQLGEMGIILSISRDIPTKKAR